MVGEYLPRVLAFYHWFIDEFERQRFWELVDFRRCFESKMRLSSGQEWRLFLDVLSKLKTKVDPYDHAYYYIPDSLQQQAQIAQIRAVGEINRPKRPIWCEQRQRMC